jgi:hypothetical protein
LQQPLNQNNILGVPAEKAGVLFTAIFFDSPKGDQKRISVAITNAA